MLACTFTLSADFFAALIARFKDAASESLLSSEQSMSNFPIDVVCDSSNYKGHKAGFNVSFWRDTRRLFHPKLLIAIFEHEVVWSDGSLNLTHAGWCANREIAMFHRSGSKTLPKELLALLHSLGDVQSAQLIREEARGAGVKELDGTFMTSLEQPIGRRFLLKAPRDAEEVHLVAPFFERHESAEPPLDQAWLAQLASRYPSAQFHVYLPQLQSDPVLVQGSREVFEVVADRLRMHPVQPKPGPLHGKAVCIVYRSRRARRAWLMTGSPNMTVSALLEEPGRGNVETAWMFDSPWNAIEHAVLEPLRGRNYSLDEVEFEAPVINRKPLWMPLKHAVYSPFTRKLEIAWRSSECIEKTELRYGNQRLTYDGRVFQNFSLVDGVACLVTRNREGGFEDGYCPIFVAPDELPACDGAPLECTPEAWLAMMGGLDGLPGNGVTNRIRRGKQGARPASHFEWSSRVRELASRVRYFEKVMRGPQTLPIERGYLLKLFQQIFDAHAPDSELEALESVWRAWVRLELWQAAENLAKTASGSVSEEWQRRARSLVRSVTKGLPEALLPQWQAVVRELRNAT
ncbi:hypothetical protein C2L66_00800 [Paraburkholderia caribensis]|nr:hypothetical protein C2L66_00800 [Paraburkholderia caribensis]